MVFSLVPPGRTSANYTGMLTRSIVFSFSLFVFLCTTGLTIAAILVPNWISYDSYHTNTHIHTQYGLSKRCTSRSHFTDSSPTTTQPPFTFHSLPTLTLSPPSFPTIPSQPLQFNPQPLLPILPDQATLIQSLTEHIDSPLSCRPYPRYSDCQHGNRYFCSMWRSVGFLLSFSVVIEGMTIVAFLILIIGGKQKREQGWRFMATLVGLAGVGQVAGTGIVAYLRNNDEKFGVPGWYLDKSWRMATASWALQGTVAVAITLAAVLLPSEGGYELIPERDLLGDEP